MRILTFDRSAGRSIVGSVTPKENRSAPLNSFSAGETARFSAGDATRTTFLIAYALNFKSFWIPSQRMRSPIAN